MGRCNTHYTKEDIPVLEHTLSKTPKQCGCCGNYFSERLILKKAIRAYGFYWWNCECGATLNLVDGGRVGNG